jgi:hypothetical protein
MVALRKLPMRAPGLLSGKKVTAPSSSPKARFAA